MTDQTEGVDIAIGVPFDGLWCGDCQSHFREVDAITLYECGSCGQTSEERRCDSCNRFMSRSDDPGCPECCEPAATATLIFDYDGTAILAEDFLAGGISFAARQAASQAEREERAAENRARKAAVEKANSRTVTWADVVVGSVLVSEAERPTWATDKIAVVRYVRHVEGPGGPLVVAAVHEFGERIETHPAKEQVCVSTIAGQGDEELVDLGPYGTIKRLPDGDLGVASSPSEIVRIQFGSATADGGFLPTLALELTGRYGGVTTRVATFIDSEGAEAGLRVLQQAAVDYAAALGIALDPDSAAAAVLDAQEGDAWVDLRTGSSTEVQIGESNWHRDRGPLLRLRTQSSNAVLDNPHVLALAVERARPYALLLTGIPNR